MSGSTWTKHENLFIYAFIERYSNVPPKELASMINSYGFVDLTRGEGAIYQHILKLKKLQDNLIVPDPVHNFK